AEREWTKDRADHLLPEICMDNIDEPALNREVLADLIREGSVIVDRLAQLTALFNRHKATMHALRDLVSDAAGAQLQFINLLKAGHTPSARELRLAAAALE